jgi:hypothetical protein
MIGSEKVKYQGGEREVSVVTGVSNVKKLSRTVFIYFGISWFLSCLRYNNHISLTFSTELHAKFRLNSLISFRNETYEHNRQDLLIVLSFYAPNRQNTLTVLHEKYSHLGCNAV